VRNSVPHMKTSLCANVQLNRSNFDFNLKSSLTPFFHWALQLFHSCLFCGHYGEVIWEVEDTFYWPLLLSRGGHCREVKIRANVWIFRQDDKKWPLQRGGRCREVAVSRGLTVCTLPALNSYALKIVVKTASSNSMTNLALKLKSLGTIFS